MSRMDEYFKTVFPLCILIVANLLSLSLSDEKSNATWEMLSERVLPEWFDESKIGILVHWGVYTVPSFYTESFWKTWKSGNPEIKKFMANFHEPKFLYTSFAPSFTGNLFNAETWTKLFKTAGAKYVVFAAKHNDGFAMWPSRFAWNWNAAEVGPKIDVLKKLKDSVRGQDMFFGVLYSIYERFHPYYLSDKMNGFKTDEFIVKKSIPQLKELVTLSEPDLIWAEGNDAGPETYFKSYEFVKWLYKESPVKDKVVTNNNWEPKIPCKSGGFGSVTGEIPKNYPIKWEKIIRLDQKSMAFRREADYADFITEEKLIRDIVEIVSAGGNALISVGPNVDGHISPMHEELLTEMGKWLKVNEEAIYGTKKWEVAKDSANSNISYTRKGDSVFAIFFSWPKEGLLKLANVQPEAGAKVTLLGDSSELKFETGSPTTIKLPALEFRKYPSEIAWTVKIDKASSKTKVKPLTTKTKNKKQRNR